MDDICKNTELFVHILGMSRTSDVQQWDEKALKRAFKWAAYFEQVHKKSKSKKYAVEKITSHLEKICSQPGVKLGVTPFRFNDLSRSSIILRKNLLENPYLSDKFYAELVRECESQSFHSQLHSLSKLKAALEVLQLIQGRFENLTSTSENKESTQDTCTQESSGFMRKSQVAASANLLRKCLKNILKEETDKESKLKELNGKLANIVKHERGVDVLLVVLLAEYDDDDDDKIEENVTSFLINFIQGILVPAWKNNWRYFLQLPISHLLAKCSSRHARFLCMQVALMQHCCEELQTIVNEKDIDLSLKETCDSQNEDQMHKYYYFLIQRYFQTLTQASKSCETAVEQTIGAQCEKISKETPTEKNIWKQLSHDLMISTAI